tara:strand:- start:329 stop:700 length:372 start_codon:yes stop_codon:yes gene_type:complete
MKFIATHTVNRNGKTVVTKGDELSQSQVIKKKVTKFVVAKTRDNGVTLTDSQFTFIITSHLAGGSRQSVAADFRSLYPDCKVPQSSLNRYKAMCEVLDDAHPNSDKMVCSARLITLFTEAVSV